MIFQFQGSWWLMYCFSMFAQGFWYSTFIRVRLDLCLPSEFNSDKINETSCMMMKYLVRPLNRMCFFNSSYPPCTEFSPELYWTVQAASQTWVKSVVDTEEMESMSQIRSLVGLAHGKVCQLHIKEKWLYKLWKRYFCNFLMSQFALLTLISTKML